jgi:hypothetical protein
MRTGADKKFEKTMKETSAPGRKLIYTQLRFIYRKLI